MDLPWGSAVVLIPLVGALVCGVLSPRRTPAAGVITTVAVAVVSGGLVARVSSHGVYRESLGGWGAPVGIELVVDGFGASMVAMTAIVAVAVSLYSVGYFRDVRSGESTSHHQGYFWSLWLVVWASLNGMFVSADLFNLYVAMEVMGLGAVALVALVGRGALGAAMRYLFVTLVGSMLYLLGVALLYAGWGVVDMEQLSLVVGSTPASQVALAVMTVGLVLKTALVPLHFWLPAAHANAPAPVSAVLSALVVKATFYILVRLWVDVFAVVDTDTAAMALAAAGVIAVVWGSVQAFRQHRLKMLVAYSTVAQLGILFVVFAPATVDEAASMGWTGAAVFVVAHAVAKGALFLSAGAIGRAAGTDRFEALRGVGRRLWGPTAAFALGALALVGVLSVGSYTGKSLIVESAQQASMPLVRLVVDAGAVLTALYAGRALVLLVKGSGDDQTPSVQDVPTTMAVSAFVLAVVAVLMGPLSAWAVDTLQVGRSFV